MYMYNTVFVLHWESEISQRGYYLSFFIRPKFKKKIVNALLKGLQCVYTWAFIISPLKENWKG